MRKVFILITLSFLCLNCSSQNSIVKDLSQDIHLNYVLASIWSDNIIKKNLWNGGQYVTVYEISDSKATPEGYFEGSDEVLSSLLISTIPDGDYYSHSKLYKIEAIYNPKILEIKETTAPNFSIKIEHGFHRARKIEIFQFEGVQ